MNYFDGIVQASLFKDPAVKDLSACATFGDRTAGTILYYYTVIQSSSNYPFVMKV